METHNQTRPINWWSAFLVKLIISPIRFYQWFISPWLGPHCRFHPTCSHYAVTAVQEHGATKGLWLAVRRISKCHPWHAGGSDPVPEKLTSKDKMVHK